MTAALLAVAGGCSAEMGTTAAAVEVDAGDGYQCGIQMADLHDDVGDLAGEVMVAHDGDDLMINVYSTRPDWFVKQIYADVGEAWSDADYAVELPFSVQAPEPFPAAHGMIVPLHEAGMAAEPGAEMMVTLHVVLAHLDDHGSIVAKERLWRYTTYAVCAEDAGTGDPITEPGQDPHVPGGVLLPPFDVSFPDVDLGGPDKGAVPPMIEPRGRTTLHL
jgi:hypothetical protein